jgi:hypothetical protein
MTNAEYEKVIKAAREHVKRTTFPPSQDEKQYEAAAGHAEYGASRH